MRVNIVLILSIFVFSAAPELALSTEEYIYQEYSNREEGLVKVPTGGEAISLISFVGYREALSLSEKPVLKLGFYVQKASDVFITAREIRRHGPSHYYMRPTKVSWDKGWNEFSPWPTKAVLVPLSISPEALGIVARVGIDRGGSGTIAPVLLYKTRNRPRVGTYSLHLLPKSTLSTFKYTLVKTSDGQIKQTGQLKNLPASVPFKISFSLLGSASGSYKLLITSKERGRTYGPSRQFTFYHQE